MAEALHLAADIPQKALLVYDGKVLLTLDRKGLWEPPGGRIHIDEQPVDGLTRELREELGAESEMGRVVHTFVFVSPNGAAHYVVVFACTLLTPPDQLKMDEYELRGITWVTRNEFEILPMRDGYKEALRKFFAMEKF